MPAIPIQNREIPCENEILQITAAFLESPGKSRPGHAPEFISTVSRRPRKPRKRWAGAGLSGWRGVLSCPGEHRPSGSALAPSRVPAAVPNGADSRAGPSEPRFRLTRRPPHTPAGSGAGGGARGRKRNSAAPLRPASPRAEPWLRLSASSGSCAPWS